MVAAGECGAHSEGNSLERTWSVRRAAGIVKCECETETASGWNAGRRAALPRFANNATDSTRVLAQFVLQCRVQHVQICCNLRVARAVSILTAYRLTIPPLRSTCPSHDCAFCALLAIVALLCA